MSRRLRNLLEFAAKTRAKQKKSIKGTIQEGLVYTIGNRMILCRLHQGVDGMPLIYGPPPEKRRVPR